MKKLYSIFFLCFWAIVSFAQAPQSISYQAVVRDLGGNILSNQDVALRISILQESATGLPVYVETHEATTNDFGLVNLQIGNGEPVQNSFDNVEWANGSFFVKMEIDIQGGTNFQEVGVSQILSVPYALHANTVTDLELEQGNGITINGKTITNAAPDQNVLITANNGISVGGSYPNFSLTNTAPDQQVILSNGAGITITGTYPNFTLTNAAPNQEVVLTSGNGITITGAYPNFTITNSATGQSINLTAGTGIAVTGTFPDITLTNTAPDQIVSIVGANGVVVSGTYPNFTIQNTAGGVSQNYIDSMLCVTGNLGSLVAHYTAAQLIQYGNYSACDLVNANESIQEMLSAGINLQELVNCLNPYQNNEIYTISSNELLAAGFTLSEIIAAGRNVCSMFYQEPYYFGVGISLSDLHDAGAPLQELVNCPGVNSTNLLEAGYTISEIIAAGYSVCSLISEGHTLTDLYNIGATAQQLVDCGVGSSELLTAGVPLSEMIAAGRDVCSMVKEGVAASVLYNAGVTLQQILDCNTGVGILLQIGISENDLINAGLYGTVNDIDGNTYHWVKIGEQKWMAENLKTTKYNNGTDIPNVTDASWAGLSTPAYAWYDNDISYKDVYGALYNFYVVETGNVCPVGWHAPTDEEWTTLTDYIALDGYVDMEGYAMRATSGWFFGGGNDFYGFDALPSGYRLNYYEMFQDGDMNGYWWSSTDDGSTNAWSRYLSHYYNNIFRNSYERSLGFAVRCIKD